MFFLGSGISHRVIQQGQSALGITRDRKPVMHTDAQMVEQLRDNKRGTVAGTAIHISLRNIGENERTTLKALDGKAILTKHMANSAQGAGR